MQGLSNKEIAWALGINPSTVKVYLSRLFPKVGANDRFELALLGLKNLSASLGATAPAARMPGQPAIPLEFPATIQRSAAAGKSKFASTLKAVLQMPSPAQSAMAATEALRPNQYISAARR